MTRRADLVTSTDVALLASLAQERSVVAACRRVGISRDRAVYRLARLGRAFGGPVVASLRGGRSHGTTQLTELGDRIVRQGFDSVELLDARPLATPPPPNRLVGVYRRDPYPTVVVRRGLRLRVAFSAEEGEVVSLLLDPETVLVARHRFPSSARNVLSGTIEKVETDPGSLGKMLRVRAGTVRLRAAVTKETVRQLALRRGAHVVLYVKATALRRIARPRASG